MNDDSINCQIYLLTPPVIEDVDRFAVALKTVLAAAPVACLQIRLKTTPKAEIIRIAKRLIPVAHNHKTPVQNIKYCWRKNSQRQNLLHFSSALILWLASKCLIARHDYIASIVFIISLF